jgi:predicted nucleotidyltransferase
LNKMKTILYKNRERICRGRVNTFEELVQEKQDIFKKIKFEIESYFNENICIYFFGSYMRGTWDELSDYDIIIPSKHYINNLEQQVSEKLKIKVNIFYFDNPKDSILVS